MCLFSGLVLSHRRDHMRLIFWFLYVLTQILKSTFLIQYTSPQKIRWFDSILCVFGGFMLIFIKIGIDEISEEVVPGLRVEINVVIHLFLIPDLRQFIALGFGNFVK